MLRKVLPITVLVFALLVPAAPAGPGVQSSIPLPQEFRPEGIASGEGDSFYVGSIPLGAVYSGSYRTGEGAVLVPPHPGRSHTGLKVDTRFDRLFVAGGDTKPSTCTTRALAPTWRPSRCLMRDSSTTWC